MEPSGKSTRKRKNGNRLVSLAGIRYFFPVGTGSVGLQCCSSRLARNISTDMRCDGEHHHDERRRRLGIIGRLLQYLYVKCCVRFPAEAHHHPGRLGTRLQVSRWFGPLVKPRSLFFIGADWKIVNDMTDDISLHSQPAGLHAAMAIGTRDVVVVLQCEEFQVHSKHC